MSNPENSVYVGNLTEDLDLVYFSKEKTFGVFYTVKPITSRSEPWPSKMPVKIGIGCTHPRTWNKYCKETVSIIDIALTHGDEIGFESHIRGAIIEILDSMREINKLMMVGEVHSTEKEDLIIISDWKPCDECECYGCYQTGSCGEGCDNPNKQFVRVENEIFECDQHPNEGCVDCKFIKECDLKL